MKWSSSAWASAEPSVGSVPAPSSSSRTRVPGPAASTIRVIERRWPENVERLWAIDCSSPMSAKTSRNIGQPRAGLGRDVEPGLVHQAQQPERPERHGLAAGVRPGHDERGVAVAEPDVDRDHAAGQARMAGAEEDHLRPVGGLGRASRRCRPRGCALAAQKSNRASAASVSRSATAFAATSAESSSRIRSISSALGDLGLAPGVAELDRHERLDEQRRAAAARVVDDPLDARPGLRLDRDHVAAVAERDDRVLERAAELRADEGVQPPPQPVVGDADGRSQPAEPRRGGVEQLAGGSKLRASVERIAGSGWSSRASAWSSGRRSSASDVWSRAVASSVSASSRNCGGSSRPPRAARSTAGPMSWAAPIPTPGRSESSARAWSVSSRPRATRTGSLSGTSVSASRRDGGNDVFSARRSRTSGNSRSAIERASTLRRDASGAGRETDGWPRIDEPPRPLGPGLAGVGDPDARASRRPAGPAHRPGAARAGPTPPGRAGRARSASGRGRRPRRRARARSRDRTSGIRRGPAIPAARSRRVGERRRSRPRRVAGGPHRVQARERLDGADEQRGGPPGRLGDDVQTVVHAVDKVHVGPCPGARTSPRSGRSGRTGRGRPGRPRRCTPRARRSAPTRRPVGVVADEPRSRAARGRPRGSARARIARGRSRQAARRAGGVSGRPGGRPRRRTPGCPAGSAGRRPR